MEDPPWLPDFEAHLKATGMKRSHLSRTLRVARELYAGLGWNPDWFPYHYMQGVHFDIMTTNLEGYIAQFKLIYHVDRDPSRGGRFRTPQNHLLNYQRIVREHAAKPPLQLNSPALLVAEVVELVDESDDMEVLEAPPLPPPVVQIPPPLPPPPLPPVVVPEPLPPPLAPPEPQPHAPKVTVEAPTAAKVDEHIPLQRPVSPSLLQAASRLPNTVASPDPAATASHTQTEPLAPIPSAASFLGTATVPANLMGASLTYDGLMTLDEADLQAVRDRRLERERLDLIKTIYPIPPSHQRRNRSVLWIVPEIEELLRKAKLWLKVSTRIKPKVTQWLKETPEGRDYLLSCGLSSANFSIEHIVCMKYGGANSIFNMCLLECGSNSHHGPKLLTTEKVERLGRFCVNIAISYQVWRALQEVDESGFLNDVHYLKASTKALTLHQDGWK